MVCKYSNETKINEKTPPTFLVHATNDKGVLVENSINYYVALKKNNIPTEMHLYKDGGHGFGLGKIGTHSNWPKACKNWLAALKLLH
ncbi:MAG: alpha/beta hydrolase [Polaribacter sp.]